MDISCRRLRLTVPGYSAQARTALCAVLEFIPSSWLVCVGLKIRMMRLMPEAGRLAAPGLPSVVRVPGV